MNIGDIITLKPNATYYNGKSIPNWVHKTTLYYRGVNANGIIFSTQKTGAITGTVAKVYVNEFTTEPEVKKDKTLESLKTCLAAIEKLDSFKELSKLL